MYVFHIFEYSINLRNVNVLEMHNSIFKYNSAANSGGACFFKGETGRVYISRTVFINNSVEHDLFDENVVDDRGGAINNNMDLLIEDSTFNGNQVHSFGGGINHEGSMYKKHLLKLINVTIIGAENPSLFGHLLHSSSYAV